MPTITNNRVFVVSVHNGWSGLEPVIGVMSQKILPLKGNVNLGESYLPFHQLFVGGLYLGDNSIYNQDGGLWFEANNTQVLQLLNDRINILKQLIPSSNEVINLGEAAKRFKTLFAQTGNFSGIVKGIDPVDDEDLATKKYVDENAGGGIRRTTVQMDIVVPAGLPLDTDLAFYDIDTLIASQLTGDLLNTVEDNRLRLVQSCGLFQAQAKIINMRLLAVYKDNGNSQYLDFNGYAKQADTNTFKRILQYSGRSSENNILHSHSFFDAAFTSDVLGQGSELYLVVQRKFNNTNEIKARVHISIDYQL